MLSFRFGFETRGMQWLANRIPQLSREKSLNLADWIGRIAYTIDNRGKHLALENLRVARENGALDLKENTPHQLLRKCYTSFARNFVDLFWYANLNPDTIHDWLEIEGRELLDRVSDEKRGAIFVTPHFGSFELSSLAVGFLGCQLNIVAQEFRNQPLTDIFFAARQKSGHRVLPRQGVMLKLMRLLRNQNHIALLSDLSVAPQNATAVIRCFGIPTSVTGLHIELANRCNATILAAVSEPLQNGKTRLRIIDLIEPRATHETETRLQRSLAAQQVWNCFEKVIRERPELWLWMYRHWRYRLTPSVSALRSEVVSGRDDTLDLFAGLYPDYARHDPVFQQRCQEELEDLIGFSVAHEVPPYRFKAA
jgi:Kdo2-lipid IVA lauroyltransferase/acyltransferase